MSLTMSDTRQQRRQNSFFLTTSSFTMTSTTLVVFLLLQPTVIQCLVDSRLPSIFYPFGLDEGDEVGPAMDDSYTDPVRLTTHFPFFNSNRSTLYVGTNGIISFGAGISQYTPEPFPIPSASLIAVWWSDVDPRCTGTIFYRQTSDQSLLDRATTDVVDAVKSRGLYYFNARWLFIVTWHDVTFYTCTRPAPTQTFQAVLVTDGRHSFVMMNYGSITWTRGAQVGFNAGDGVNFSVVPGSRTDVISEISSLSNVEVPGRMMYRVDAAVILPPTGALSDCQPWQELKEGHCVDFAPAFSGPTLSDPLIQREYFEFVCEWTSHAGEGNVDGAGGGEDNNNGIEENNGGANQGVAAVEKFVVKFLFDGAERNDGVDVRLRVKQHERTYQASLHERYLHGQLGKWLSCSVESYWEQSPHNRSRPAVSNTYRMAITASVDSLSVSENDAEPARLTLTSTLPVTCQMSNDVTGCQIQLKVVSVGDDIAVRQRHPATGRGACTYVIADTDWRDHENRAYNDDAGLEITARIDSFSTAPRVNKLRFKMLTQGLKQAGGEKYTNFWEGYIIQPDVLVYRYDAPGAMCSSSGDPRLSTFDGLYYSTYSPGQFIYARSTSGTPFEVQVRHWPCARAVVSCVCGVAMREGDVVLILDMCQDGIPRPITYNNKGLPSGAGITTTDSGHTYKIQMPSGNKILLNQYSWGMNMELYINGKQQTRGLCGSPDGNKTNDLLVRQTLVEMPRLFNGQAAADVINSWRVDADLSLFQGDLDRTLGTSTVPDADPSMSDYCTCKDSDENPTCGGDALSDAMLNDADPQKHVKVKKPPRKGRETLTKDNAAGVGNMNRPRREATDGSEESMERLEDDEIDFTYNPTAFTANSTIELTIQWPTANGITQQEAESTCRQRIVNIYNIGAQCYTRLANSEAANVIVQKCVDDVQISGDFSWADDKVAEMQQLCVYDVTTRNYSDINDTSLARRAVKRDVVAVTSYRCEPFDCNRHGSCVNGSCVCNPGYVGPDCSIDESAVPSIIRVLDSTSDCDVRARQCLSVSLATTNVNRQTAKCKITVSKLGGQWREYVTSARVTSLNTTTCYLPSEPLQRYSHNADFRSLDERHGYARDFHLLPQGGAVQTYTVAISNDGRRFSDENTMRIIDTLCMECDDVSECRQKPGTCLINGYCFAADDLNPLNAHYACQPETVSIAWTRVAGLDHSLRVLVATLSGVVVVLCTAIAISIFCFVRNVKRKLQDF